MVSPGVDFFFFLTFIIKEIDFLLRYTENELLLKW